MFSKNKKPELHLKHIFILTFIFTLICLSCKNKTAHTKTAHRLNSTSQLKNYLFTLQKKGIAIGHQDATSYGIGWTHDNNDIKSDVKAVSGKFPAVFGFDIGHLELGHDKNLDGVPFDTMKTLIIDAYKKGGIITISWHADNPTSGGNSWDKTPAVKDIINNGPKKQLFNLWLEKVASFLNDLHVNGQKIPIIFRPYHEMNGAWFWWGAPNCTADEYKQLWIETYGILKHKYKTDHLLFAYSPNKLNPNDEYLKHYPGDQYVDILGIDIYDFNNNVDYIKSVKHDLSIVKQIANKKNKPYAFTETGLEKVSEPNWFSEVLYPTIENSGVSWVLLWRNHTTKHHYMPYKGHHNENDFKHFEQQPKTLFLEDINIQTN